MCLPEGASSLTGVKALVASHGLQYLNEARNFFESVVMNQRGPYHACLWRKAKTSQQPGRIHVSVPDADALSGAFFRNGRSRHPSQVETQRRNAQSDLVRLCKPVDRDVIQL